MKKESLVFDAWAIVAWLNEEPPAPKVRHLLEEAEKGNIKVYMSLINAGEVFYITAKKDGLPRAKEIVRELLDSPITFVLPSEEQIWKAAEVKARFSLSYADAFAVALGILKDAPVATGDPEIKALEKTGEVNVLWLSE